MFGEFFGHGVFAWQLKWHSLEIFKAIIGISGEFGEKLLRFVVAAVENVNGFSPGQPVNVIKR